MLIHYFPHCLPTLFNIFFFYAIFQYVTAFRITNAMIKSTVWFSFCIFHKITIYPNSHFLSYSKSRFSYTIHLVFLQLTRHYQFPFIVPMRPITSTPHVSTMITAWRENSFCIFVKLAVFFSIKAHTDIFSAMQSLLCFFIVTTSTLSPAFKSLNSISLFPFPCIICRLIPTYTNPSTLPGYYTLSLLIFV